jgi:type IV pilus assembly protein PilX
MTQAFRQPRSLHRTQQRGVALATALILLILVVLIGLAAIRGTTTQQRMTANFYDRELAFQNAEAALRAGEALLAAGITTADYRACDGSSAGNCEANPFTDSNLDSDVIKTAATGTYEAGANASGQPQFVIELICTTCTTASDPSECQSANCQSYGAQSGENSVWFYRITARSGDPESEAGAGRAAVTLQAMYAVPPPS